MTPRVAVITSLYRTDRLLAKYCQRLVHLAARTAILGLPLEAVVVANDATPRECTLLDDLAAQADTTQLHLQVLHVPRETLYASWNRAIAAAKAPIITPWNVDDLREPQALVEGVQHLEADPQAMLIDFPIRVEAQWRYLGLLTVRRNRLQQAYPHAHTDGHPADRWRANTFFMFRRDLLSKVGEFDTQFRIAGDVEWHIRIANTINPETAFRTGHAIGGTFVSHGGNLSGANRAAIEAEENIISLMYEETPRIRVVDPDVMSAVLTMFPELKPPREWLEQLKSDAMRQAWNSRQNRIRWQQRRAAFRAPFSALVDWLGLRSQLAGFGLVNNSTGKSE